MTTYSAPLQHIYYFRIMLSNHFALAIKEITVMLSLTTNISLKIPKFIRSLYDQKKDKTTSLRD